jgi:hypothetical protein
MNLKVFVKINGVTHEVDDGCIALSEKGPSYLVQSLIMNLNVHQIAEAELESNSLKIKKTFNLNNKRHS